MARKKATVTAIAPSRDGLAHKRGVSQHTGATKGKGAIARNVKRTVTQNTPEPVAKKRKVSRRTHMMRRLRNAVKDFGPVVTRSAMRRLTRQGFERLIYGGDMRISQQAIE